jgi:hypothetical protein
MHRYLMKLCQLRKLLDAVLFRDEFIDSLVGSIRGFIDMVVSFLFNTTALLWVCFIVLVALVCFLFGPVGLLGSLVCEWMGK